MNSATEPTREMCIEWLEHELRGRLTHDTDPMIISAILNLLRPAEREGGLRALLIEAEALLCDERAGPMANDLAKRIIAALASPAQAPSAKEPGVRRYYWNNMELVEASEVAALAAQVAALTERHAATERDACVQAEELGRRIDKLTAENAAMRELLEEAKHWMQHTNDYDERCGVFDDPQRDCDCGLKVLLASKAQG